MNVSTTSHPNAAVSGWTSRGRLTGTASLANSLSVIEIVYQWKDSANYDYIRCQRGASSSDWTLTLITRRGGVESSIRFGAISASTVGATWCLQWYNGTVGFSVGDAAGVIWLGYLEWTGTPTLTNGGKVGYRTASSGTMTIAGWWRHPSEGPLNGDDCEPCVGGGACEGCCISLADTWSVDLSAFSLPNANFTGCTDVDGVYVLDPVVGSPCQFQSLRRLTRYEYSEPQLGATNCYSRDLNGISCFDPSIRVHLMIYKLSGACTIDLRISLTWAAVGVPCDICQFSTIALYRLQSATIDDLCNGPVTLDYVSKDPSVCGGTPPATVTVTGT